MSAVLDTIHQRKSVRAYQQRPVPREVRDQILGAALRSPTAGNLMLYSILEVNDQRMKERLVETCDDQPFIAEAPLVWVFLADYQRWYDYFVVSGVEDYCRKHGLAWMKPEEGDLMLACCDAIIAAQTAVLAAESLGLGSCYIGDILENYEVHREMFGLPPYVLPICMLCIGYPTREQRDHPLTDRFDRKFIVFENRYHRLTEEEFKQMFPAAEPDVTDGDPALHQPDTIGVRVYRRKFSAPFSVEMRRSVRAMLHAWRDS